MNHLRNKQPAASQPPLWHFVCGERTLQCVSGPASPIPSVRPSTASGRISPSFPKSPGASSFVSSTAMASRRASISPKRRRSSGTAISQTSPPANATAIACMGRGNRSTGIAAIQRNSSSTPTARPSRDRCIWDEAVFPYLFNDPEHSINDRRQRAVHAEVGRHQSLLRLGARSHAAHAVARDDHLRGARQRLHHAPSRHPRKPARNVRRPRASRFHPLSHAARRHRGRDPPRASVRPFEAVARQRSAQLLGLQLDQLPCAAQRIRRERTSRAAGDRSSSRW